MLKLGGVPRADGHSGAVHVELSYNRAPPALQFAPERLRRTFAQPQQPDEDVLPRIFVRQKCFPATVGRVVPSNELDLKADITAGETFRIRPYYGR